MQTQRAALQEQALLPAGLVSYLPVELLRHPSWGALGGALGASLAYAAFAVWLSGQGLRRYASGHRFTVRGCGGSSGLCAAPARRKAL